jgi:hypothetical protein
VILTIRPSGGQPPAGLSAARGLATLRAYSVFFSHYQLVTLILNMICLTTVLALSQVGWVPRLKHCVMGKGGYRE